jgi:tryptophan synthase alpha chain
MKSNRISDTFAKLQTFEETALIPYIMAGDPSLVETEELVLELEHAGADLIELGVPFSDPIADGPVIQQAAERALRSGTSLARILESVKNLRAKTQIPLILMTYYNTIMAMGEKIFCKKAVEAGIDGVIVPDMPPEEADLLQHFANKYNLIIIYLLAPTSTSARRTAVIQRTQGFIYYVSLTGITGSKLIDLQGVRRNVEKIQKVAKKPIAVGFGIATPEDAKQVAKFANGVIVGSALVRKIAEYQGNPNMIEHIGHFTRSLKSALLSS